MQSWTAVRLNNCAARRSQDCVAPCSLAWEAAYGILLGDGVCSVSPAMHVRRRSHPVWRILEARRVQNEHQVPRHMVAAQWAEVPIACTAATENSALPTMASAIHRECKSPHTQHKQRKHVVPKHEHAQKHPACSTSRAGNTQGVGMLKDDLMCHIAWRTSLQESLAGVGDDDVGALAVRCGRHCRAEALEGEAPCFGHIHTRSIAARQARCLQPTGWMTAKLPVHCTRHGAHNCEGASACSAAGKAAAVLHV